MDILTNATLLAIQNMTWNGMMGFQSAPSKHIIIDLPDLQYGSVFESSGFDALSAHQGVMGQFLAYSPLLRHLTQLMLSSDIADYMLTVG